MAVSRNLNLSNGDVLIATYDTTQESADIQVATTEKIGEAVCNVDFCTTPVTDVTLSGNTYYSGNLTISPWLRNSIIVAIWCEFIPVPASALTTPFIIGGIYPLAYFGIRTDLRLFGSRTAEDGTVESVEVATELANYPTREKFLLLAIYDSTTHLLKLYANTEYMAYEEFTIATTPAYNTTANLIVGNNTTDTASIPIKYYKIETFWYNGSPTSAQISNYYNGISVPWVKGGLFSPSGIRESDFLWIRDTGSNIGTNMTYYHSTGDIKLGGEINKELYVYRQCISPVISTTDTLTIPSTGTAQSLTVNVPSTMSWRVNSVTSPFTAPMTLQSGAQTISIGASENTATTTRSGVLNLCSEKIDGIRLGSWASTISNASYNVTLTGTDVLTRIQNYSFSMEFWFSFNEYYTDQSISLPICHLNHYVAVYYYYNSSNQTKYIGLYISPSQSLFFTIPINSDKNWHVVISADRLTNTVNAYVDGVLVTTKNTEIPIDNISYFTVGNTRGQFAIDAYGARVFNCALTQEDVTRLYFNGHPFLEKAKYLLPILLEYKFTEENLDYTNGFICENTAYTGTNYNMTPTNITDANICWGASKVVTLVQEGKPLSIFVTPTTATWDGTFSYSIPYGFTVTTTDTDFTYNVDFPKTTLSVERSGNNITIYPTTQNTTSSYLTGTLTVKCVNDTSKSAVVRLYQKNANNDPIPEP